LWKDGVGARARASSRTSRGGASAVRPARHGAHPAETAMIFGAGWFV